MIEIDKFINCIISLGKIKNFIIENKTLQIENLRKFHNFIKFNIILDSCKRTNAKNLLDIACGRGGDLQKWINNKNNLQYILAFDSHKESIFSSLRKGDTFDGAIARFQNVKQSFRGKIPYIVFKNLSILDNNILEKLNSIDSNKKYDIVSCQFALHYFCENDNILNNVLSIISIKLRKGGLFIGTATDGDLIYKILNNGNVNIPLLSLIKRDFNNYLFYIQTEKSKVMTTQNYFELQGVSSEFYLFKEKLKNIALKNNLQLIEYKSFYEWYQIYKKTQSFYTLTIYEMVISFLNFSFIFKKI
jgi:mRNA (guanine-N7-)-methyltransferase